MDMPLCAFWVKKLIIPENSRGTGGQCTGSYLKTTRVIFQNMIVSFPRLHLKRCDLGFNNFFWRKCYEKISFGFRYFNANDGFCR